VDEKDVRNGHLDQNFGKGAKPALQRIHKPLSDISIIVSCIHKPWPYPVDRGHSARRPDHDGELTDAAEDVDWSETVFQGERDEHRSTYG